MYACTVVQSLRQFFLYMYDANTRDTSSCSIYNVFLLSLAQSHCAQYAAEKRDEEKMCDHLIRAAKYRDHVTATQLIQKIVNILTDKHGAWGNSSIR